MSRRPSTLLIGNNGAGKTTVGLAFEILQRIGRGTNRVRDLVSPTDFFLGRSEAPMRFEIEVELEGKTYIYTLALEFPQGFKELRGLEEKLEAGGKTVYSRESAKVSRNIEASSLQGLAAAQSNFPIDWHLVALPIIQQRSTKDPASVFKQWLARILILRPMPSLILGHS